MLAVVVLAAAGAIAAVAFLNARDDAAVTTTAAPGPGEPLPAGARRYPAERGLAAGNVIVLHRASAGGTALRALAVEIAGPPSVDLRTAGQAVLVSTVDLDPGPPIEARAAGRRQRAARADDPALRAFIEFWLGRGA